MSRVSKFLLSFALFVAVCYAGLIWFVNNEVGKGIDQAVNNTPGMSLSYADLSVSLADHSVTLEGVDALLPDGRHLSADTVVITDFDQIHQVPHYVRASATGVSLPATSANFGPWSRTLVKAGFNEIHGDIDLDYSYDLEKQLLNLRRFQVSAPDLCDVSLSGTISQLDLGPRRMEKLLGLRIDKAELHFTNHSLVTKLMGKLAADLGTDEETARRRIASELDAMARYANNGDNRVAEDALRGLKRFIDDPGAITISARPAEPVPYLWFFMGRDIYDNIRLLNLSVTTDSGDTI